MRLQDKVAIVTGAGAGVGKAVALRYAHEGARVVVAEIDEASGEKTTAEIVARGQHAVFVRTDLGRLEDIGGLMKRTVTTFGRVDVLMNNAGVTRKLDFFEVKEADWDWIHSINAKGAFFCMQAAAKEMAGRREGKIINIASIAGKGFRGTSNVAYAGSKGARGRGRAREDFGRRGDGEDGRLHPAAAVEHAGRHRAPGRLPGLRGGQEHHGTVVQRRWRDHIWD
jgi:NAD(P)-dependent dehydrogenase (short-subunit alcohol dehydrogenase family)